TRTTSGWSDRWGGEPGEVGGASLPGSKMPEQQRSHALQLGLPRDEPTMAMIEPDRVAIGLGKGPKGDGLGEKPEPDRGREDTQHAKIKGAGPNQVHADKAEENHQPTDGAEAKCEADMSTWTAAVEEDRGDHARENRQRDEDDSQAERPTPREPEGHP